MGIPPMSIVAMFVGVLFVETIDCQGFNNSFEGPNIRGTNLQLVGVVALVVQNAEIEEFEIELNATDLLPSICATTQRSSQIARVVNGVATEIEPLLVPLLGRMVKV
jgi:hypothetical protein